MIDDKKEEINQKIEDINNKLTALNEKFDADKIAFQDQKKLVERIEWIKKEQKTYIKEKKE